MSHIINLINLIHFIIVLLVIISPFVDNLFFKKNILIFLVFLLFQYITGYEKCGLTELEYMFMGEEYQHGFIYRIVNPLIKVPEAYFDKWLIIIHIIYVITLYTQLNIS
jgi:hypothetical protein